MKQRIEFSPSIVRSEVATPQAAPTAPILPDAPGEVEDWGGHNTGWIGGLLWWLLLRF